MKRKDILDVLAITDTPMDLYKISNENELEYMIPDIERVIRSSREYRGWIVSKKYKHKQTICKSLNIDVLDYKSINIEMDHFPITLWDIIWIVGIAMLDELEENEYYTSFQIADRVIREHLDDQHIATVSLTTTMHQMRHEGLIKPREVDIHGDYKAFLKKYKEYIPEIVMQRIKEQLSL